MTDIALPPTPQALGDLATEVASTLFGEAFHCSTAERAGNEPNHSSTLAMGIRLAGQPDLSMTLAWERGAGKHLSSLMFACRPDEADDAMQHDALGELLNILAGQLKSIMALDHKLGLPQKLAPSEFGAASDPMRSPGVWLQSNDNLARVWVSAQVADSIPLA